MYNDMRIYNIMCTHEHIEVVLQPAARSQNLMGVRLLLQLPSWAGECVAMVIIKNRQSTTASRFGA